MGDVLVTATAREAGATRAKGTVRFFRKRQNVRLMLYTALLVCDVAAIRCGFAIGVSIKGWEWLAPNGVELGWLILPFHLLIGFRRGAYSHAAVESRVESIRLACSAFLFASALICMLVFFQYAGVLVSRLAFGVAIVASLGFLVLFRTIVMSLLVDRRRSGLFGELLLVDGVAPPKRFRGDLVDVRAHHLVPDLTSPEHLARLAQVIAPYDRVVVACSNKQRRSDWAQMLKNFDTVGEVLLDEGSPMGAVGVSRFQGQDTIIVSRGALSLGNRIVKRAMDIAVSAAALVILAPLLLVVALAIRLDSPGPALFSQPRVGRGNQMFRILKFRSMRSETSDLAGNRSTSRDDDRITRIGRIIRATSIDELPQLLNVLKGDMSIVGPRPHALGSLAEDKLFWEVDETYWRRHALKPGITGLAQVRGFRGATLRLTDLQNRLQADLEYITGWTLWRDIKIVFATLRVLVHPHAY